MTSSIEGISEQEAQIYDRQIRLWGVKAQQRMRQTRLLVYGITGLSAEMCKNLVLAGVGNVCIMDSETVSPQLLASNFLISESDVGKNRATASVDALRELNPLVKVTVEEQDIDAVPESFFNNFDIVYLTNCSLKTQLRVNDICRQKGILFFAGQAFGFLAYTFQDLLDSFDYEITDAQKQTKPKKSSFVTLRHIQEKTNLAGINRLTKAWLGVKLLLEYRDANGSLPSVADAPKLIEFRNKWFESKKLNAATLPDEYIQTLCLQATSEINPICAIVGGIAAQEVIKAISRDADPINNYFVFDGLETYAGLIETIK